MSALVALFGRCCLSSKVDCVWVSESEHGTRDTVPVEQVCSWWRPTPDQTLLREVLPEHRPEYC